MMMCGPYVSSFARKHKLRHISSFTKQFSALSQDGAEDPQKTTHLDFLLYENV